MDSATLRGVYCPVLTPFDQQLNPDVDRFVEHCKNLLNQGCHGLAVFGTTGEATSLSVRERIDLLDALLEADVPAQLIVPGTGCSMAVIVGNLAGRERRALVVGGGVKASAGRAGKMTSPWQP